MAWYHIGRDPWPVLSLHTVVMNMHATWSMGKEKSTLPNINMQCVCRRGGVQPSSRSRPWCAHDVFNGVSPAKSNVGPCWQAKMVLSGAGGYIYYGWGPCITTRIDGTLAISSSNIYIYIHKRGERDIDVL